MRRFFVLAVLALVGVAAVAGCGGSGVPDDVSYQVLEERIIPSQRDYIVRLNREVSEDTLRAITLELRDQWIEYDQAGWTEEGYEFKPRLSKVVVAFWLPSEDYQNTIEWASVLIRDDFETISINDDVIR